MLRVRPEPALCDATSENITGGYCLHKLVAMGVGGDAIPELYSAERGQADDRVGEDSARVAVGVNNLLLASMQKSTCVWSNECGICVLYRKCRFDLEPPYPSLGAYREFYTRPNIDDENIPVRRPNDLDPRTARQYTVRIVLTKCHLQGEAFDSVEMANLNRVRNTSIPACNCWH